MEIETLKIIAYSLPILLIIVLVLSIILFVNRKKIKAKYNVGYISSFFFTAYMLTPLTIGIPALLSNSEEAIFALIMSLVYPLIGLIVFMLIYRKQPLRYKFGKFFGMLGFGICSAYIVVFKMLSLFHHSGGSSTTSTNTNSSTSPSIPQPKQPQNLYDSNGKYIGYTNEYGQTYDENGKYQGYINEYGDIYNADGKHVGRINEYGEKYDQNGKYRGRVNERGENYNEDGKFIGRASKY